jgi:hypothetical protein
LEISECTIPCREISISILISKKVPANISVKEQKAKEKQGMQEEPRLKKAFHLSSIFLTALFCSACNYDSLAIAQQRGNVDDKIYRASILQKSAELLETKIESSAIGEKPESSLHHPIRHHLMGISENKGFSKLEWIERSF